MKNSEICGFHSRLHTCSICAPPETRHTSILSRSFSPAQTSFLSIYIYMLYMLMYTYLFTGREKAFCVLEYAQSQSNKTVQHAFVMEFSRQSPTAIQIWTWHKQFKEEGCLCRRKGSGQKNKLLKFIYSAVIIKDALIFKCYFLQKAQCCTNTLHEGVPVWYSFHS